MPRRTELAAAVARGEFWWAAGIEDTFITAPHPVTGRTLDEYELTGHYRRWAEDIDLLAELGVGAARYGIPWHRLQPAPSTWRWEHADRPLERLLDHGIAPQVDLVHYGLPSWIEGGFLNPDYPRLVAEYAARLADRYRGRIFWYTPLNEPRITAWYCGRLGWWPPSGRSLAGFVAVMLALCRGIKATVRALRQADPEIVDYHVDATDLLIPASPGLAQDAEHRQQRVFLALDLLTGRIDERHPLHGWLIDNGATAAAVDTFRYEPLQLPIVGLNLYPEFTLKRLAQDASGRPRIRMPTADASLLECVATMYWQRYRVPLAISETATRGTVPRRLRWLDGSVAACRQLRAAGVPLAGYTWWPLFSLVAWAWRQGTRPVHDHLLRMGLWDLDPDADLARRRTPVADRFRALVAAGQDSVGPLAARAAA